MANYFRSDGWVKSALGPAVPGSQIYICLQPANIASLPPSPLANIFSDPRGLVPLTQPIITDGFGHYDFYAQAGVYTLIVGLGGIIQQVYPDQSVGGGSAGGTAIVISVNGTPTTNQFAANFQGAGSVAVSSDGSGDITITGAVFQTNGATNTLQTVLNLKAGANIALASDAFGGVTVTGTVTTGIPIANALWFPSPSSSTFSAVGDVVNTTDSGVSTTFVAPSATTNAAISSSGHARVTYGTAFAYAGRNFTFKATAQFTNDGSGTANAAIGMTSVGSTQSITGPPATGSFTLFVIPSGDTTWHAQTSNGSTTTDVDTLVTFTARHALEIDYTVTSAVFKIDGTIVATISTNLPVTTSALGILQYTSNNGTIGGEQILVSEYLSCASVSV